MISFEAVTTWPQAQELMRLRNECREWMTGDTSEITEAQQRRFLREQLAPRHVYAWLLRRGDAGVAGYALLRLDRDGIQWMSCGLTAAARGQGLGTLLVRLVTDVGHHMGLPVRLQVWQDNKRAWRTYQKAGYGVVDADERDGRALVTMEHR